VADRQLVAGSPLKIIHEADAELERAPPVVRGWGRDHELALAVAVLEPEVEGPEVPGVVELEQAEAERPRVEACGGLELQGAADDPVVDAARVGDADAVDPELLLRPCARPGGELGPARVGGGEAAELVGLGASRLLADARGLGDAVEAGEGDVA